MIEKNSPDCYKGVLWQSYGFSCVLTEAIFYNHIICLWNSRNSLQNQEKTTSLFQLSLLQEAYNESRERERRCAADSCLIALTET